MRRLSIAPAAAAAALAAGAAVAQTDALPEIPQETGPVAWSDVGVSAARLIGGEAVDRTGGSLGEVHDVLMTDQGRAVGVVLEVGGLLGIAEKFVVFRAQDVDIVGPERVEVNVTQRELERRIAFDYDDVTLRQFAPAGFGSIEETEADAERARYLERWGERMDRWSGRIERRADKLEVATANRLREAWRGVEGRWADLQGATLRGWDQTKEGFEQAFESMRETFRETGGGSESDEG